jgi:hypothetical protein
MAIRDHFGQPSERAAAAQAHEAALEKIRYIVTESHPGSSADKLEAVAQAAGRAPPSVDDAHERWAVAVITSNRIQVCSRPSMG